MHMGGVGQMAEFRNRRASVRPPRELGKRVLGYRCTQVLAYVRHMIEDKGVIPSYQMIADELGIGQNNVCDMVKRLERRGLLKREPGCRYARRIRLG